MALIPPRSDAVIRGKSPFEQSDENLRGIQESRAQTVEDREHLSPTLTGRVRLLSIEDDLQ